MNSCALLFAALSSLLYSSQQLFRDQRNCLRIEPVNANSDTFIGSLNF